jgi:hypothetical protein
MLLLFCIGFVEMVIATAWTKLVSDSQIMASGVVTLINIFIWFYVLQTMVENIHNWGVVMLYALGCALGTVMTMYYFRRKSSNTKESGRELPLNI